MPRIYTSASDPLDFCRMCFPSETVALATYGNIGDGPDDRGNCFGHNEDHPPYDDPTMYRCERCNKPLGDKDD